MTSKTVVILGGGVGGLVAANELRRRLPQQHRVILVEKDPRHAFAPSFLWVMVGDRRPDQITRDMRTLVSRGVEVTQAQVVGIEPGGGRVETTRGPIHFDSLVIALGAEYAPEMVAGLTEATHTFYTWEGATRLHQALQAFPDRGGRVAVVVSALPYKCPGAPHEGAMLLADYFRRRNLGSRVEVHLYTPEPQPMPVAGPALGEALKEMLQMRGVLFHPLHKLVAVDPDARELAFEGQAPVKFDLLVAIPPHRSPRVVRDAGLTGETGWIPVERATLRTRYENVYAVGDVTAISIPGRWKPEIPLMLPKAGVFAHAQAEVVARRIAAEIAGAPITAEFGGNGYCMLEAGEAMAGFAFGDFFAEPSPKMELRRLGRSWHWGKVLFEQWWLTPPGPRREALRMALGLGARWLGVPAVA
jgi:sulfide:quinone oxidoreductase